MSPPRENEEVYSFKLEIRNLLVWKSHQFRTPNESLGSVRMIKTSTWLRNLLNSTVRASHRSKNHLQIDAFYRMVDRFGLPNCAFLARNWYPFHQCWDTLFFFETKNSKNAGALPERFKQTSINRFTSTRSIFKVTIWGAGGGALSFSCRKVE